MACNRLAHGPLAAPPMSIGGLAEWSRARSPESALFAFGRLLTLVLAWYLLVSTCLSVIARLTRLAVLIRATDLVTVPLVRRVVAGAVGVSLSAAPLALARPASAVGQPPALAVGPPPATAAGDASSRRAPRLAAPLLLPGAAEAADPAPTLAWLDGGASASSAPPQTPRMAATWTVQPGDSFWRIAAATLQTAWGRSPRDAEIVPYWHLLIDHNRTRLALPQDPDLLFPAQRLLLPAPPAPPGGRP